MAKLLIYRGNTAEREVVLEGHDLRIGRSEQNDIVLEDATKAVSRQHAELQYENNRYVLVDRGSENGIWVHNRRMPRVVLVPNEPVTLGPFTLIFLDGYSTASAGGPGGLPRIETDTSPDVGTFVPASGARHPTPAPPASGTRRYVAARSRAVSRLVVFVVFAAVVIALVIAGRAFRRVDITQSAPHEGPLVPPGPPPPPPNVVKEYLMAAQQLFDQKDYDGARSKVGQALAIESGSAEAAEMMRKIDAAVLVPTEPTPGPEFSPGAPVGPKIGNPGSKGRANTPAPNPRELELAQKYEAARAAADHGSLEDALRQFADLDPSYKDVAAQMGGVVNQIRARVDGALEQARRQESAGELIDARSDYKTANSWQELLRRHQLFGGPDENVANAAKLALAKLEERIRSEGNVAFEEGRREYTFLRYKKAVPYLDRAYKLLPEADPRRKQAKEWLDISNAK